ncbi:hypothetical protein RI367_005690 [Sorochytrium milnesiophthora]
MSRRPLVSSVIAALAWALSIGTLRSYEVLHGRTPFPYFIAVVQSGVLAVLVILTARSSDTIFTDMARLPWRTFMTHVVPYSLLTSIATVLFIKCAQISTLVLMLFALLSRVIVVNVSLPLTVVALMLDLVLYALLSDRDQDLRALFMLLASMFVNSVKRKILATQARGPAVIDTRPRQMLYYAAPTTFLMSLILFLMFEAPHVRGDRLQDINYSRLFACASTYALSRFASAILSPRETDISTLISKLQREVLLFFISWLFGTEWILLSHLLIYPALAGLVYAFYNRFMLGNNYAQLKRMLSPAGLSGVGGRDDDIEEDTNVAAFWRTIPVLALYCLAASAIIYGVGGVAPQRVESSLTFQLYMNPSEKPHEKSDKHYLFQPAPAEHQFLASVPPVSTLPSRSPVPATAKQQTEWRHVRFAISSYSDNNDKMLFLTQLWARNPEIDWTLYWSAEETQAARKRVRQMFKEAMPHRELKMDFIKETSPHVRWALMLPHLYKSSPRDVQWFLLADDDTLWLPQNVLELLNKYDPSKPYYLGSVSESAHQARRIGEIAFGGGGTALSRAMVEEVVPDYEKCLEKFKNIYGGDDRLGRCVAEAGYKLTREPGFNQFDLWELDDIKPYVSSHMSLFAPLSIHRHDAFNSLFPTMDANAAAAALFRLCDTVSRDLMFRRFWWVLTGLSADTKQNRIHARKASDDKAGDIDLVKEDGSADADADTDATTPTTRTAPLRKSQQKTIVMIFGYHIRIYDGLVPVTINQYLPDGNKYSYNDFWFSEWRIDQGEMVFVEPWSGRKITVRCHGPGGNLNQLCA